MNCATHTETPAVAFCRSCGRALCNECRQEWQGVVYCSACAAPLQAAGAAPRPAPSHPPYPEGVPSPGLAFALGLIPGVGAIYNGQYAKGIIHVVVLGLLISIAGSGTANEFEPLIGMFIAGWFFYMAFEAYHTAKRRMAGDQVDEFSGLLRPAHQAGVIPVGPILLILLGAIFLLNTLGYLSMEKLLRFWPVLLIALGVYLLVARLSARPNGGPPAPRSPENTSAQE